MLLSSLLKSYLLECKIRNFSLATISERGYAIDRFISFIGDVNLEEVSRTTIKTYLTEYKDKAKANTVNSNLRHLKGMFVFALEEGIMNSNPADGIKALKEEKTVIRTYATSAVQEILDNLNRMDFTSIRNKAIVTLLVETGIRNSELCNIKLDDVMEGCIKIHGKGNKVRYVPITEAFSKSLAHYLFHRKEFLGNKESEYLFISRLGDGMTRGTLIKTIKDNVFGGQDEIDGIPTTVHNFRRFFAQNMLDGTDLYTVSRLMGHTDVKTTERYLRSAEDEKILSRGMNSPLTRLA